MLKFQWNLRSICRWRQVERTCYFCIPAENTWNHHIEKSPSSESQVIMTSPGTPSGEEVTAPTQAHGRFVPSNFPVPSAMVCRGDVVTNWEFFRQQWEDYEVATGLNEQSAKVRLASLRSMMGKECLQIFMNLHLTPEQRGNVNSCLDAIEAYFKPQKNVVYERFLFNSCTQASDENFDAYLHKLRKLAATCKFGSLTDEMIRDRIVIGVKDIALKGRLLREHSLSLVKAVDLSRASEIAKEQLNKLEGGDRKTSEEVNFVKSKHTQRQKRSAASQPARSKTPNIRGEAKSPGRRCKFCGKNQKHNRKEECPAYGQECRSCHKKIILPLYATPGRNGE